MRRVRVDGLSRLLPFAQKVERFVDSFTAQMLVKANLSDGIEERQVDNAAHIFFIVQHPFVQVVVVFTRKVERSVIRADKLYGLPHFSSRKAGIDATQKEFAHQPPGHSVAVE